jgi:putative tricarboxylic transport membrane protein
VPRHWLFAGILLLSTLGTYTVNNNVIDLVLLWLIGLVGFFMRVLGIPVAPAVIGLILGPMAEVQFRRALAISQGDPAVFVTHPISAALLGAAALAIVGPALLRVLRKPPIPAA